MFEVYVVKKVVFIKEALHDSDHTRQILSTYLMQMPVALGMFTKAYP